MAENQARHHVVLFTPVGSQPYAPTQSLRRTLEEAGHHVTVVGEAGDVPMPPVRGYQFRDGRWSATTAALLLDRAAAGAAFTRELRSLLRRLEPDVIVVWEPRYAIAIRAARPRGCRMVMVTPEYARPDRLSRLERALAVFIADAVAVTSAGATSINLARQVLVPYVDGSAAEPAAPAGGNWALLTSTVVTPAGTKRIEQRRSESAAAVVVVDARSNEQLALTTDAFAAASGAPRVVHAFDDDWLTDISDVYDPTPSLWSLDHRHRAAFARGCAVWLPAESIVSGPVLLEGVTAVEMKNGWQRLQSPPLNRGDLTDWARQALVDPLHPRADIVRQYGEPISRCPFCDSSDRDALRQVGASDILRCGQCGLVYGSPKVPDAIVYDSQYHDGTGRFGTDYVHAQWYCERLSEDRLACLDRAAVAPGRMLDVGTGIGHYVVCANNAGWRCDGLELVAGAVEQARELFGIELINESVTEFTATQPYDVVALGQTLEHFTDPVAVLKHIREAVLVPNGALLIEVPHIDGTTRRIRGGGWSHWQSGDHVSFFNSATLRAVLHKAGFDVVYEETTTAVYPGIGAIGVAYSLGLLNPDARWYSLVRTTTRLVRARLPRRGLTPRAAGAPGPNGAPAVTPFERALLGVARIVDRTGNGDHLRVVARAR